MKKKPLRAIIIGFGNVAQKLAAMLGEERGQYPGLAGLDIEAVAVFTGSHGSLVEAKGMGLEKVLRSYRENNGFQGAPMTAMQALETLDYDVLVELSFLNIRGRGEPAISHARAALQRSRHVVTANKGPAAFAYRELSELAHKKGVHFLFESAVMDGAPVFSLEKVLAGCRVSAISGILNTTTNFVISRLEAGESMARAIKTAQELGFAEADPSLDLDGWDAAAKISILANFYLGAATDPLKVERRGIADLTPADAARAMAAGKRLKLICRAWLENGSVRAVVGPETVPVDHCFAAVSGKGAALRLETDMMGPLWIVQEDPGLADTAAGVIQDLLAVAQKIAVAGSAKK
jgi:homoserine dehydrogenase